MNRIRVEEFKLNYLARAGQYLIKSLVPTFNILYFSLCLLRKKKQQPPEP